MISVKNDNFVFDKVQEDKLAWLRETLEWQKDMQDPDEFLNTLKTELFEDEVAQDNMFHTEFLSLLIFP